VRSRILLYMVTRNESDRYLESTLDNARSWADRIVVYDDQSTDATQDIVSGISGIDWFLRPDSVPSFLEDESAFREAAWRSLEIACEPVPGDWVVSLDADELLLLPETEKGIDRTLRSVCEDAEKIHSNGIWCHVHEIWGRTPDNQPQIRVDGEWGKIKALRVVAWEPNGDFQSKKMGGGSVPSYVTQVTYTNQFEIAHLGYYSEKDRQLKYERYQGRSGHGARHIQSIILPPKLDILPNTTILSTIT